MRSASQRGLLFSGLVTAAWLLSLGLVLVLEPGQLPFPALVAAVLLRTMLQTALFIVGHDAMHGVLWSERQVWNHRFGALALALYAALPYARCRTKHAHHHAHQASEADPDFLGNPRAGALRWYLHFMGSYLAPRQMGQLLLNWLVLALALQARHPGGWIQVLLFCSLPLLLSSLQLFVFGTYLPHRLQKAPWRQSQASSLEWPVWLSLLACFHFGYHREHHESPALSWFELPGAHAARMARVASL